MKTKDDLRRLLLSIDHRGYPAYKDTRGKWSFGTYILSIDHVQGDPFASPSNVSIIVPGKTAAFPAAYLQEKHRRIALQDLLLRRFYRGLTGGETLPAGKAADPADGFRGNGNGRGRSPQGQQRAGSGKSGLLTTSRPGQEILERSACRIDPASGDVTVRFEVGFPANGRTINARALIRILEDVLPQVVASTLFCRSIEVKTLEAAIDLADDQKYIRDMLPSMGLCAFVADGSVLPRQSGISPLPMKGAVPFRSPDTLAVTLDLPHKGALRGMGIRRGVTLIVGGGYHGKSTLLGALEKGVYNHIAGDGREYVITDDAAAKIRAEDGRSIVSTDISLFISDLPNGKDTVRFSTEDASGSTSQAANVMEAIEAGTDLLLIDEDTSATNFMVRDALMARVVSRDKEPITPFISRIRDLYEQAGVSTILVAGSSGAFFHVADTVIQMDRYIPVEITASAKEMAAAEAASGNDAENAALSGNAADLSEAAAAGSASVYRAPDFRLPGNRRIPRQNTALLKDNRLKLKVLSVDSFLIAHDELQLRGLEQIVDREQTAALAHILKYMQLHIIDGRRTFEEVLDLTLQILERRGLEEFYDGATVRNGLARVRRAEIAGMLSRYRKLRV